MKRVLSLIFALLLTFSATSTVLAAGARTKTATLSYNNIKVTLDGKQIELSDANEPFVIDGTTYLPVRAIANALGLEVGWDSKTSTVVLTSNSAGTTPSASTGTPAARSTDTSATTPVATSYVLNTSTKKFHYSTCSSVSQIKASNYSTYTGSRDDLIKKGYSACKKCNP